VHQNLEITVLPSSTGNANVLDPDPNSGIFLDPYPVFAESVFNPVLDVD
jgi:hypothetical protein